MQSMPQTALAATFACTCVERAMPASQRTPGCQIAARVGWQGATEFHHGSPAARKGRGRPKSAARCPPETDPTQVSGSPPTSRYVLKSPQKAYHASTTLKGTPCFRQEKADHRIAFMKTLYLDEVAVGPLQNGAELGRATASRHMASGNCGPIRALVHQNIAQGEESPTSTVQRSLSSKKVARVRKQKISLKHSSLLPGYG